MVSRTATAFFLMLATTAMLALPRVSSQTPLLNALRNNNDVEARHLIEQGIVEDINAVDWTGDSTLMYAIRNARNQTVHQLLEYSIRTGQPLDINYVNQRTGDSTLMYAILFPRSQGFEQLLHYSIETGQILNINYVNQQSGFSTLMVAIGCPTRSQVQQLLDYSIRTRQIMNVNHVDPMAGWSTFEYALTLYQHRDNPAEVLSIIRLLINYPSFDVNRPLNERGETALMLAMSAERGRADLVRALLEVPGIEHVNQRNNERNTIQQ